MKRSSGHLLFAYLLWCCLSNAHDPHLVHTHNVPLLVPGDTVKDYVLVERKYVISTPNERPTRTFSTAVSELGTADTVSVNDALAVSVTGAEELPSLYRLGLPGTPALPLQPWRQSVPDPLHTADLPLPSLNEREKALARFYDTVLPRQQHGEYSLHENVASGSYGEVWRACHTDCANGKPVVLKRLFVEKGESVRLSGLREIHFGTLLKGFRHVGRFIEFFSVPSTSGLDELWLVFHNEGPSLHSYLYDVVAGDSGTLFVPSARWTHNLKTAAGDFLVKEIVRQLLECLADIHSANVTHRDIKPENMLVRLNEAAMARVEPGMLVVKIIDFGSSVDTFSVRHLYGHAGPSVDELTTDYAPPESLFNNAPFDASCPQSYDMWSVGVVLLQLLLGTSHVFELDRRSHAIVDMAWAHKPEATRASFAMYRAILEYCLFEPTEPDMFDDSEIDRLPPVQCTNDSLQHMLIKKDPLRRGFPDFAGRLLLKRLLQWYPRKRITAGRALEHAYFREQGMYQCSRCGAEFEFDDDLQAHLESHHA